MKRASGRPRGAGRRARRAADSGADELALGIRLVHLDADLVVVDKPVGVLSATTREQRERDEAGDPRRTRGASVADVLRKALVAPGRAPAGARGGRRSSRPARIWIVHRLDQAASGLLVFARSERAFAWLKEDLRARRIERRYAAVLEGELGAPGAPPAEGSVQSFLREVRPGRVASVPAGSPRRDARAALAPEEPRLAVTHYRALAVGRGRTLVELTLDSGRKHQIRVHAADLGHPVVGDRRYGRGRERSREANPISRLALHACELAFEHPVSGQRLRFESSPPREFFELVGAQPPGSRSGIDQRPATEAGRGPLPSAARARPPAGTLETSWDHVADWYDELVEDASDHYRDVILPGTLRLLAPLAGLRVLDLACGQGILCRALVGQGASAVGVDDSPRLIELARRRARGAERSAGSAEYCVADARELTALELGSFDAVACVMALENLEPLEPVIQGAASMLRPGGALVAVLSHPAFRAARQTSWGFEPDASGHMRQYRRVDGYLSSGQVRIVCNPGEVAAGEPAVETWSFHRPLQTYVKVLAGAGLWIDRLEEWPSLRRSDSGPRAAEENRARREIPMFLALRAIKAAGGEGSSQGASTRRGASPLTGARRDSARGEPPRPAPRRTV